MKAVVSQLKKERTRLEDELHRVTAALTAFGKAYLRAGTSGRKKRTISAAGRKRIAAAQRHAGQDSGLRRSERKKNPGGLCIISRKYS